MQSAKKWSLTLTLELHYTDFGRWATESWHLGILCFFSPLRWTIWETLRKLCLRRPSEQTLSWANCCFGFLIPLLMVKYTPLPIGGIRYLSHLPLFPQFLGFESRTSRSFTTWTHLSQTLFIYKEQIISNMQIWGYHHVQKDTECPSYSRGRDGRGKRVIENENQ